MKVTILYATEYGNCRSLAQAASALLTARGVESVVAQMDEFPVNHLSAIDALLVITSTHGEGEAPENGKSMLEAIKNPALRLNHVRFSVCALGDSDYEDFCQCGKDFDRLLEERGATRFYPRQDCDVEFEDAYTDWISGVLGIVKMKIATAS